VLRSLRTIDSGFNEPYVTFLLVEAGFVLELECWQFNVCLVIFEIKLKRKKRRTNV